MRFLAVAIACLFAVDFSQGQDCSNGRCFRTPVRNTVAAVVQAQPVRSAVKAVVAAQPLRSTVRFLQNRQPLRTFVRGQSQSTVDCPCVESLGYCPCGQLDSALQVGSYDYDGALIVSVWLESVS